MMEYKDYYKIMGLKRDATQDEIKRAYRQLARKYHPDVSKAADAEQRFKEVGVANAVLKDLKKRAAYDLLGSDWKPGEDFRPPPDWHAGFEFSGSGTAGSNLGGHAGNQSNAFSDFFEALYGHHYASEQAHTAHQSRGEDRHAKVFIDLEDAYVGATRKIRMQTPESDAHGKPFMRSHHLNVAIPRGVRSGQHIRLKGQGAPGIGNGQAGDLYLEIGFNTHSLFRVEQRDVYLNLPLAPWEAALGATLEVPTPEGKVDLKIPPGSLAGGKLRLKGRGIPGNTPGDFYAVMQLALPQAGNDAEKLFYTNMAEQFNAFKPRAQMGA